MPSVPIVVVDDDDSQRYATRRMLETGGYTVQEASTGTSALEMAQHGPGLVILDVNLPDINGFEVCRRIKADPQTSGIAVLHLSAHRITTAAKVTGLESGADAYLTQPVEREELLATVATLLRARAAEQALRESEESYRLLFEANPVPCWVFDNDSLEVLAVNQAAVAHYGYSEEEFLSRKVTELRPAGVAVPARSEANARSVAFRSQMQKKDGAVVDVEITWKPIYFRNRPATHSVVYDLTEQSEADEAARNAELRQQLLDRILVAQEEERRKIARELHDETGQLLTSLLVSLRALEESKRLAEAKARARELRQVATRAIDEVGRIARGLHPTLLEDLGLRAALRRLVDGWAKMKGPEVMLNMTADFPARLPYAYEIGVYRIVQEGLTNAHKHAKASKVVVDFMVAEDTIEITVSDNGIGMGSEPTSNGGLGLQSMRERARSLGGQLEISSSNAGTTLRARIPLRVHR